MELERQVEKGANLQGFGGDIVRFEGAKKSCQRCLSLSSAQATLRERMEREAAVRSM